LHVNILLLLKDQICPNTSGRLIKPDVTNNCTMPPCLLHLSLTMIRDPTGHLYSQSCSVLNKPWWAFYRYIEPQTT